jgi:hypothetical protein
MTTPFGSISKIIGGVCAAMLVAGCVSKPEPEPVSPAPSVDQVQSLRASILQVNDNAKVGVVSGVISDSPLAMVSDISTEGIKPGDVFSFVGADKSVVANGTVVEIVDGKLAIRYEPATRAPMVGDVAVKF